MIPRLPSYPMPDPASFPATRVAWTPDASRSALLVHDLQTYFLEFYDLALPPVPELLRNVSRLIARCRELGIPVVYTAQPGGQRPQDRALLTDFWGTGLRDDPAQTRVHPQVAPQPGDTVLTKWRYSAFKRTPLEEQLRAWGRDQLLVCGVYAHIGCLLTAAEAFMLDVQPFLIGDALADFSEAEHRQALTYAANRCAQVTGTDDALRALGSPAWTEERVRGQVAALLGVDPQALHGDDDLLILGLDSVRLMLLTEDWQREGQRVSYADVAARPTLNAIMDALNASAPMPEPTPAPEPV
ncbi:isochorismatase family protein [Deinococcus knuensis]|uniref:isochorismatase n=1 Tax=Deinococcus knuensis TaxID=1837380 RepID=A0ABQ2SEF4_9DEIO|nr:isochorismatase family protein [Deinococcus knuensis]GGS25405.1 isochorismatase [Deinococcus knuensis]